MNHNYLLKVFLSIFMLCGRLGYAMEDGRPCTPPPVPFVTSTMEATPHSKAAVALSKFVDLRVEAARQQMYAYLAQRAVSGEDFFIALDVDGVMLMSPLTIELFGQASLPEIQDLVRAGSGGAVPAVLAFYNEARACGVDIYIVTARPATINIRKEDTSLDHVVDCVDLHINQLLRAGYMGISSAMIRGMDADDYEYAVAPDNSEFMDQFIGRWKQDALACIMRGSKYKRYIFLDDTRTNGPTHRIPTVEQPATPLKPSCSKYKEPVILGAGYHEPIVLAPRYNDPELFWV